MTKEKLERAHEISVRIDCIRKRLDSIEELPTRPPTDERAVDYCLIVPKELIRPIKDMLESYFRKELEKAEKEFEEI